MSLTTFPLSADAIRTHEAYNERLINLLREQNFSEAALLPFRKIPRGFFVPRLSTSEDIENCYSFAVVKQDFIHISSPTIYAHVLESLELSPGLSFLQIGSGSGYLSSMVATVIGPRGVNHGVEINRDAVMFCRQRLDMVDAMNRFSSPGCLRSVRVVSGNAFLMDPVSHSSFYDRIYCSQSISRSDSRFFAKMLKLGGIMIFPSGESFLKTQRTSAESFVDSPLASVRFLELVQPSAADLATLPRFTVDAASMSASRSEIQTLTEEKRQLDKKVEALSGESSLADVLRSVGSSELARTSTKDLMQLAREKKLAVVLLPSPVVSDRNRTVISLSESVALLQSEVESEMSPSLASSISRIQSAMPSVGSLMESSLKELSSRATELSTAATSAVEHVNSAFQSMSELMASRPAASQARLFSSTRREFLDEGIETASAVAEKVNLCSKELLDADSLLQKILSPEESAAADHSSVPLSPSSSPSAATSAAVSPTELFDALKSLELIVTPLLSTMECRRGAIREVLSLLVSLIQLQQSDRRELDSLLSPVVTKWILMVEQIGRLSLQISRGKSMIDGAKQKLKTSLTVWNSRKERLSKLNLLLKSAQEMWREERRVTEVEEGKRSRAVALSVSSGSDGEDLITAAKRHTSECLKEIVDSALADGAWEVLFDPEVTAAIVFHRLQFAGNALIASAVLHRSDPPTSIYRMTDSELESKLSAFEDANRRKDDPPPSLCDPITHLLMVDAVKADDGLTYERCAIALHHRRNGGRSPVTDQEITDYFVDDVEVSERCRKWREENRAVAT